MTLPKALQKANEEADRLLAQANNANTGEPTREEQPQANPEHDSTGTPAGEPTPQEPQSGGNVDWEHKYKVLQGKFNQQNEQNRSMQEKVRQLESTAVNPQQLASLQHQITELQQRNSQLEQAAKEQPAAPTQLNPYLAEEYGEEFAQAVAQQAEALVKDKTSQLENQISQLSNQFQSTEQQLTQSSINQRYGVLTDRLKAQGIDFEQVDSDPLFHEWLAQHDEYSGQPRQQLLQAAFQSGDVDRTVRFYQAFMSTQQRKPDANPLSQHVEAPRHMAADAGTQPATFDQNAFQRLHDDFRRGRITQEQFEQQERNLFAALNNRG